VNQPKTKPVFAGAEQEANQNLQYQRGFGWEFQSEAVPGALPAHNNPQRPPMGLYSELITTTSFMAPRAFNRRSYVFRLRPSVVQGRPKLLEHSLLKTAPLPGIVNPTQMRWAPFAVPDKAGDFVDGLATICANGDAKLQAGMAVHIYLANRSMDRRYFACNDGELLIIPQEGSLRIPTEFGIVAVEQGEFIIIPRGVKFRVELTTSTARGLICENYGAPFRLPELGPIGSTGLANPINFCVPTAAYEDQKGEMEFIQKLGGRLWTSLLTCSPLDVVAWRGSTVPCKFKMTDFVTMGAVSHEHADPSIFTALTSPSDAVLGANVDLIIIGPQWIAADDTFRTAPFHRNAAVEFAAVIKGHSPNKAKGAGAGSMQLHNAHAPHGPDPETFRTATARDPAPFKIDGFIFIALETRFPMVTTDFALNAPESESGYPDCWAAYREERKSSS
jgi:homogentisate 1,2-dioxygenase